MKIIFVLFFLSTLLFSCDPLKLVYVQNHTNSELNIQVQYWKQANDSPKPEVHFSDTLIEKPKALLKHKFAQKLVPEFLTDTSYRVAIPSRSVCLLGPLTIGFPIKKVKLSSNNSQDSIIFSNVKMKELIRKGNLKKINWVSYVYNWKFELK